MLPWSCRRGLAAGGLALRRVAEAGAVLPLVMLLSFGTPAARGARRQRSPAGERTRSKPPGGVDARAVPACWRWCGAARRRPARRQAPRARGARRQKGGEGDESGGRREAAECLLPARG